MDEINQATELRRLITEALWHFRTSGDKFAEGEVQFRFDAIRCMLIMALHDTEQMIAEWTADEAENPPTV